MNPTGATTGGFLVGVILICVALWRVVAIFGDGRNHEASDIHIFGPTILPDNKLVAFGLSDGHHLGLLSARPHLVWASACAAQLGPTPVYPKGQSFDPFPFPAAADAQKASIGAIAEELKAHRKRVLAEHAHLTLTGLYNVLERLKAGAALSDLNPRERRIFDDGLVLILKELHERLDLVRTLPNRNAS